MNIRETAHAFIASRQFGASMKELLEGLPYTPKQIADCIAKESRNKSLILFKRHKTKGAYFASEEQMQAVRLELLARWDAEDAAMKIRLREAARLRGVAKRLAQGIVPMSQRTPKPKPVKVPKPPKMASLRPKPTSDGLNAWKRAEAIHPPHVKVQVLPGFNGDRWQVEPPRFGWASMGPGRYFNEREIQLGRAA